MTKPLFLRYLLVPTLDMSAEMTRTRTFLQQSKRTTITHVYASGTKTHLERQTIISLTEPHKLENDTAHAQNHKNIPSHTELYWARKWSNVKAYQVREVFEA